jgi:hypothetical protein
MPRTVIRDYTDWALKGLLALMIGFFGTQVKELSSGVQELNTKVSVIVVKFDTEKDTNADQEMRIRSLEAAVYKHRR